MANNNNVEINLNEYLKNVKRENDTSVPCKHTVRTGRGVRSCKNRTKLYPKYCWIHNVHTVGLKIAKSTIPNAGKGLFATKNLPENFDIRYGRNKDKLTQAQITRRYNGNNQPYGLCGNARNDNRCWDATPFRSGLGRWVNDIHGTGKEPNADFFIPPRRRVHGRLTDTKPVVRTDRPIRKGEEILVDYGEGYWSAVNRENQRAKQQRRESLRGKQVARKAPRSKQPR